MPPENNTKPFVVTQSVVIGIFIVVIIVGLAIFLIKSRRDVSKAPASGISGEDSQRLIDLGTAPGESLLSEEESQKLFDAGTAPGDSLISDEEKKRLLQSATVEAYDGGLPWK